MDRPWDHCTRPSAAHLPSPVELGRGGRTWTCALRSPAGNKNQKVHSRPHPPPPRCCCHTCRPRCCCTPPRRRRSPRCCYCCCCSSWQCRLGGRCRRSRPWESGSRGVQFLTSAAEAEGGWCPSEPRCAGRRGKGAPPPAAPHPLLPHRS